MRNTFFFDTGKLKCETSQKINLPLHTKTINSLRRRETLKNSLMTKFKGKVFYLIEKIAKTIGRNKISDRHENIKKLTTFERPNSRLIVEVCAIFAH